MTSNSQPAAGWRRPTVTDVAREAGVSVATAGRVLGGYGRVGEQLRATVQEAADRLGYSPNVVARSMRSGNTNSVGFVGADISNPFFATALRGICDVAREEGYEAVLMNSDDRLETERNAIRVLLDKQIEGIVVAPTSVTDVEHLKRAQEHGVPVVLLDRHIPMLDTDSVGIDNEAAAREAVEHLIDLGHRRIGLLASVDPEESPELVSPPGSRTLIVHGVARPSIDRIRGYISALRGGKIAPRRQYVRYSPIGDLEHAHREAYALLGQRQRPTAVFAADNVTTQGLFTAARARGLSVPGDLSLVGFDDLDWTTLVEPALTVVAQSPLLAGRRAAERLFLRIKGNTDPVEHIVLATELVVRGSTGPAGSGMPTTS